MKRAQVQIVFTEGINEFAAQDLPSETSQGLSTVGYLENYNPNKQMGSVILRDPWTDTYVAEAPDQAPSPTPTTRDAHNINPPVEYRAPDYADLSSPTDVNLVYNDYYYSRFDTVTHSRMWNVSVPYNYTAKALFTSHVKEEPHDEETYNRIYTRIVARVVNNKANDQIWRMHYEAPYMFSDAAQYGETILFTTYPDDEDETADTNSIISPLRRSSPVYAFRYVDLAALQLTETPLMKGISTTWDSQWVINESPLRYLNDGLVAAQEVTLLTDYGIPSFDPDTYQDIFLLYWFSPAMEAATVVAVSEQFPIASGSGYDLSPRHDHEIASTYVSYKYPWSSISPTAKGFLEQTVLSHEYMDMPKYYNAALSQKANVDSYRYIFSSKELRVGKKGSSLVGGIRNTETDSGVWTHTGYTAYYVQLRNWSISENILSTQRTGNFFMSYIPDGAWSTNYLSEHDNSHAHIVGTKLYDYISNYQPRLWIPTEEIDVLLVGKFDGVDVLMLVTKITVPAGFNLNLTNSNAHTDPEDYLEGAMYNGSVEATAYNKDWGIAATRDRGRWETLAPSALPRGQVNKSEINGGMNHFPQKKIVKMWNNNATPGEYNGLPNFSADFEGTNGGGWARTTHWSQWHSLIFATIAIRGNSLKKLLAEGCTEISLYAMQPNPDDHILYSIGQELEGIVGVVYNKPKPGTGKNFSDYALVKTYRLVGESDQVTDWADWQGEQPIATNSWREIDIPNSISATPFYIAIPMQDEQGANPKEPVEMNFFSDIPVIILDKDANITKASPVNQNRFGFIYDDPVDGPTMIPNTFRIDEEGYPSTSNTMILDKTNQWTPDFLIWDYPISRPLALNGSGEYWKGLAAKCVTMVKGVVFVADVISKRGIEQGIVRHTTTQGAAASQMVFLEEAFLQLGSNTHTALGNYREQLWAFSRTECYRVQVTNPYDITTWEYLDVITQGTFAPKTITPTTYGMAWLNEGGVWISDGGEVVNLAVSILNMYKQAAVDIVQFTNKFVNVNLPKGEGAVYHDPSSEFNEYMELNYDSKENELVVSTPYFEGVTGPTNPSGMIYFIYSFTYKNWRVEKVPSPEYTEAL